MLSRPPVKFTAENIPNVEKDIDRRDIFAFLTNLQHNVFVSPHYPIEKFDVKRIGTETEDYYIVLYYPQDIIITLNDLCSIQDINRMKISNIEIIPKATADQATIQITWTTGALVTKTKKRQKTE
jgi:hypothetical protein